MAQTVNPPRGMRDFLPAEKARRESALAIIRDSYTSHGFDQIETPVVEDSSRLHAGLGGDNEKLAFAVMRRGLGQDDLTKAAESGDYLALADLGLRFDLTVPLARFYATHRAELPSVFRAIQIAPVWRAERPQKGRFRQFVQCDIDIIGEAGVLAEIELVSATLHTLDALGIQGCTVRINDRRILTALLAHCGFAEEQFGSVLITVDKLDKIGVAGVVAELTERAEASAADPAPVAALETFLSSLPAEPIGLDASAVAGLLPEGLAQDAQADLAAIAAAVGAERLRFDPLLVRGMGYYTGPIFEISHPEFGFSLGGGGRYDGMIGRFTGTDVPAAGFSIGFERIVDLADLAEAGVVRKVALISDSVPPSVLVAVKARLIAEGATVRLEKRPKKLAALLDRLAAEGFTEFATLAGDVDADAELDLRPLTAR